MYAETVVEDHLSGCTGDIDIKYLYDGAYGQQMQAIADAFAAIDHMKEEVLKIKGARQCPQCGATVPEDTEFCGKCGAKLNIFED